MRVGHGGLSFQVELDLGESLIRYVESPLGCATLWSLDVAADDGCLSRSSAFL